ncbi:unnamed protein product, partial [Allacma fusca]
MEPIMNLGTNQACFGESRRSGCVNVKQAILKSRLVGTNYILC